LIFSKMALCTKNCVHDIKNIDLIMMSNFLLNFCSSMMCKR